jgi:hypothetical protein
MVENEESTALNTKKKFRKCPMDIVFFIGNSRPMENVNVKVEVQSYQINNERMIKTQER